jgi:hypothetical protein
MSCRITNLTEEQVKHVMASKGSLFPRLINQTAEETNARFEEIERIKTLRDDIYYLHDKYEVKQRVSEKAKRKLGHMEPSKNKDNEVKREAGTKIHDIANRLLKYYTKKEGRLLD